MNTCNLCETEGVSCERVCGVLVSREIHSKDFPKPLAALIGIKECRNLIMLSREAIQAFTADQESPPPLSSRET